MNSFFVWKCYAKLFCAYSLCLYCFGKRSLAKRAVCKMEVKLAPGCQKAGRKTFSQQDCKQCEDKTTTLLSCLLWDNMDWGAKGPLHCRLIPRPPWHIHQLTTVWIGDFDLISRLPRAAGILTYFFVTFEATSIIWGKWIISNGLVLQ